MAKNDKPKAPDYEVGYKRPPKTHQFQPGKSGNPKGKPKGTPSIQEALEREARRHVRIKSGDAIVSVSRVEALARRLFQKALEGDLGAARLVLQWSATENTISAPEEADLTAVPDDEVIGRMLGRFSHLLGDPE